MTGMPRSVEWLRRLVAHDTTSRGPNQPLIDEVAEYLTGLGVTCHVRPHPTQSGKSNLIATIPAGDGSIAGGVLLSGHTDVVPVDGQDWSSDPWTATVVDDRIIGRGTADMKGFLAVVLEAVPAMLAEPLNQPVHLALSYDEELGCLGAEDLVTGFTELGITPRVGFVGEPTGMRVIRAHKSSYVAEATFTGVAAHSSLTNQGVNAIEYAAELVRWCRERADHWRTEGPFDEAFPIAYTTMSVNTIDGGIAQNTVPDRCVLRFEYRAIAEVDPDQVLADVHRVIDGLHARMQAEDARAGAGLQVLAQVPGLATDEGPVSELCRELGLEILPDKVTYGTEAGMFAVAGVDTVVCGPGDIAVAHTADEFVTVDQLRACEGFIDALIARLRR